MSTTELVCGTGNWSGPKPGDPDNNIVLTATPAFGGIDVSWTYPSVNPFAVAHTLVYRSTANDYRMAIQIAIASGNQFFDKVSADVPAVYFYWIQVVSVNGTVGSLIGPASSVARPTIEETIRQLTGKIDQGVLAQSLKAEIGNIALLGNTISGEIQNRMAANQAIGEALAGVQGDVDTAITLLESEVVARTTANSALVTSLNLMGVGLGNSIAGLAEEIQLVAGPDSALASKLTTLEATVNGDTASGQVGLSAKVDEATGAIESMYTAKVNVNGLIGGFGIHNSGETVEAGFDVDRFWVGRSGHESKKPFIIENDEVFIDTAIIRQLTADKIDTRGLTIKDKNGVVVFAAGNPLDWETGIGGTTKPQSNATRNVFTGDWKIGSFYDIGDIVIDPTGNGWSALANHSSTNANKPPSYPTSSKNDFWTIYAIKGEDALVGRLTNGSATIPATYAGVVSAAALANASGTYEVHRGVVRVPSSEIVFSVVEANGCAGTVDAQGNYAVTAMTEDSAYLMLRATIGIGYLESKVSLSKSRAGFDGVAATSYWINCSPKVVVRDPAGKYVEPTVYFSAVSQLGGDSPKAYVGRFTVESTTNGVNYTNNYISLEDESSVAFTLPNGIKSVKVRLYENGLTDASEFITALDEEVVTIIEDGVEYDVKIESSNGTVFRVGQAKNTKLIARVFRNGVDVTDQINESKFRWTRVSMEPREAPYDDATWNSFYQAGYKQIQVMIDDVHSKATFHCQITQ